MNNKQKEYRTTCSWLERMFGKPECSFTIISTKFHRLYDPFDSKITVGEIRSDVLQCEVCGKVRYSSVRTP